MTATEYILIAFPAIFVILNPMMAASSFMSMTMDLEESTQIKIAKKACLTAFVGIVVFAVAGQFIFRIFNITVEAFRIAGGIILFSIGMNMLKMLPIRMKQTKPEMAEMLKRQDPDIGIIPLGIPILCGPGTITTILVLTAEIEWQHKLTGSLQMTGLIISAALSVVLIYFILINSSKLIDLLKVTGIGVMTRVMGLILTVIATQFVINGVKGLLPKLAPLLK